MGVFGEKVKYSFTFFFIFTILSFLILFSKWIVTLFFYVLIFGHIIDIKVIKTKAIIVHFKRFEICSIFFHFLIPVFLY